MTRFRKWKSGMYIENWNIFYLIPIEISHKLNYTVLNASTKKVFFWKQIATIFNWCALRIYHLYLLTYVWDYLDKYKDFGHPRAANQHHEIWNIANNFWLNSWPLYNQYWTSFLYWNNYHLPEIISRKINLGLHLP